MPRSRRADAVIFGFDFQVNAAIVLMIENIRELESLRLEGNYEDIELKLNGGGYILAQAKAIEKSSSDFSHVRENLKKALTTLSEASHNTLVEKLILITNSPNPLNDKDSRSVFYGDAHRSFDSLPDSSKSIISGYLAKLSQPLNTDKFMIQVLPFETDDEDERYKVVKTKIDDFIGSMNLNIPGLGKKLMTTWHEDIFKNGSKKDASIVLGKKDVIWPIIVIATDIERCDEDLQEEFDSSAYDEIVHRYRDIIDSCCERCDFFIKVLYDYNDYQSPGKKPREKCLDFAMNKWSDYLSDFETTDIDDETKQGLIQVILYSIVRNRLSIDKIKREVNL